MYAFISGISLLFHQLLCFSIEYSWKSGRKRTIVFPFFLKLILTILGPWHFHENFKVSFKFPSNGQKGSAGILIVFALTLQLNSERVDILICWIFQPTVLVYLFIYLHCFSFLLALLSHFYCTVLLLILFNLHILCLFIILEMPLYFYLVFHFLVVVIKRLFKIYGVF